MKMVRRLHASEELKQVFRNEAREELEKFVQILLDLIKHPSNIEAVHKLLRLTHNLKGVAAFMRLTELMETVYCVENLLDRARKGNHGLDSRQVELLLKFSDDVLSYIAQDDWEDTSELHRWQKILPADQHPAQNDVERFESPLVLSGDERQQVAYWQKAGRAVYGINISFKAGKKTNSRSALAYLKYIQRYGLVFKTAPDLIEVRRGDFSTFKIVLMAEAPIPPALQQELSTYSLPGISGIQFRNWVFRQEELELKTRIEQQSGHTLRVEASKIDRLLADINELSQVKNRMVKVLAVNHRTEETWYQLGQLVRQLESNWGLLHSAVNDLRMVTVRQMVARFPKLVHDLSIRKGKPAEVVFYGEDTEVDKQIADKLVDPLTHLVFNAIDHGLETEEQRKAAGKPAKGLITLGASYESNQLVIEVRDDGKGIDLAKIRAKALADGLIDPGRELSHNELLQLIFRPGFTTAEQLTEISGRGVGLDVVQNGLRALQGEVEVITRERQGTTFRLRIPINQ